jgi:uncharacterized delta-60 repeat protein
MLAGAAILAVALWVTVVLTGSEPPAAVAAPWTKGAARAAQVNVDGHLDTLFGSGGKVSTSFNTFDDSARAVAVMPDGKIVVAGNCGEPIGFCLARYLPGGGLDPTFGSGGIVITTFGDPLEIPYTEDRAYGVLIQPDGKIVAGGFCLLPVPNVGTNYLICVARYNGDGTLDTSFGGDGKAVMEVAGSDGLGASAIALQGDGKIVAAGLCSEMGGDFHFVFCLARFNSDGTSDATFDGDGFVTTAVASVDAVAYAVGLQGDGKIVAAGYCGLPSGDIDFCVARYNSNGSLDTSFDGDGIVVSAGPSIDLSEELKIQRDGKIVVAGYCNDGRTSLDFCLHRYEPNGALDLSFDGDGKVMTDFNVGADFALGLAIQPDNKVVATGYCEPQPEHLDFCLARYNPDGSLDPTFGDAGKATADIAGDADIAYAIALQRDGKMVVAGACGAYPASDFCLARFTGTASVGRTERLPGAPMARPPTPEPPPLSPRVPPPHSIASPGSTALTQTDSPGAPHDEDEAHRDDAAETHTAPPWGVTAPARPTEQPSTATAQAGPTKRPTVPAPQMNPPRSRETNG